MTACSPFFKSIVCCLLIGRNFSVDARDVLISQKPIQACIIPKAFPLTPFSRNEIARCLGWRQVPHQGLCQGYYEPIMLSAVPEGEMRIRAQQVSFYNQGISTLTGGVEIEETNRAIKADKAHIERQGKGQEVSRITLLGKVLYRELDKWIRAKKVVLYPKDKTGKAEEVLYRFDFPKRGAILPAMGRARMIEVLPNKNYYLDRATYTTCAPTDRAWQIEAKKFYINGIEDTAVAKDAVLRWGNVPLFYTPYMSFPVSKKRKSGFLAPTTGYSNVGGFDLAIPYYWNIAPNYDASLNLHPYSLRGVMMGGQFRYLLPLTQGSVESYVLPQDKAYAAFIRENVQAFPTLSQNSNRWSLHVDNVTNVSKNLRLDLNYQQVSDDYFLQDFSNNLAILTERQLLQEAGATYTWNNWIFKAKVQAYQTLQPIDETPIADIYRRLPQVMAQGLYEDLPLHGNLSVFGELDAFSWPNASLPHPEGPRFFFNPTLSFPQKKPWGYVTPSVQWVASYYDVHHYAASSSERYSNSIPRMSVDGGLFFERLWGQGRKSYLQTVEPRFFYLYVPYKDQTAIPIYDSAFMMFNYDQLFRMNRFSGLDRIGDSNQLAYALTTRWIKAADGIEKASFSIGQMRYFSTRKVGLCQSPTGYCVPNPLALGYVSELYPYSPIASRALVKMSPLWTITGEYMWDPATRSTNNANLHMHWQAGENKIINLGYTYLVNGDITYLEQSSLQKNALHQASIAFSWPLNEKWSTLGGYAYNLSKGYQMMSFLGFQYNDCCFATRIIAGRSFQSLSPTLRPQYVNSIYVQFLLKGIGSLRNSSPQEVLDTYVPGYVDLFRSS